MGGNGNGNGKAKNPALEAERDIFKRDAHEALLRQVDLVSASRAHTDAAKLAELRATSKTSPPNWLRSAKFDGSAEELAELRQEIIDEVLGFGPLEDLMRDPDVTEIMVNGPRYDLRRAAAASHRTDDEALQRRTPAATDHRAHHHAARAGASTKSSPMVDARLPDGSRVNAIIEPLAIDGATLTIRRFGKHRLTMDDLIKLGVAPPE